MKLNESGDFCLLYVEPTDERQSLFEAIGAQRKPVVLMLLLESGQSRPRLFQRPEDFSDLKHVRRQSGISVIFLTSGSEHLAQMAARYGFPAYPSIDAFANFLAHGRRATGEESDGRAPRRARTGPLPHPSSQNARHATPTGSLPTLAQSTQHATPTRSLSASPWPAPAALAVEDAARANTTTAPLNEQGELTFWPAPEHVSAPFADGQAMGRANGQYTPVSSARAAPGEPPFYQSEIPPRRSALSPHEQYTRHPNWEPEAHMSEHATVPHARYERPPQAHPEHTQAARPRSSPDLPAYTPSRSSSDGYAPPLRAQRRRRGLMPVLILLSILILGGAGLGSFIVISRAAPIAPAVARPVGSITFMSSEQLNETTSQGIDDQVQITLHTLSAPTSGKSYYAWLLGDADLAESQSILLGKLTVVNGSVNMFYSGDAQHTNLLQIGSRFLITEEDSTVTPLLPSPETSAWRYYGALPTTPDLSDKHHYAFLNHLRHLLADEPILDEIELPGGLNNWFTRNTQTLVEWTTSARDQWQASSTHSAASVRDVAMNVLSYLDGMSFMPQDTPPASQRVQVDLDTHLAGLGLVNVSGPSQNPASYIDQILYHLNGLLHAPGSPASVRATAAALLPAMSSVETWLQNLRSDDKQLLAMSDAQLGQAAASALLNDMVVQASNAYTGNTDPATGHAEHGVAWIHQQLQSMATISVSTYIGGGTVPEVGPSTPNGSTTLAPGLQAARRPS